MKPGTRCVAGFRALVVGVVAVSVTVLAAPQPMTAKGGAPSSVPSPAITLPPDVNEPYFGAVGDLAADGYVQEEFFFSGDARAYTSDAPLSSSGEWDTTESGVTAPYQVRMVVHRPDKPQRFNGTVLVEWLNVSGGSEGGPDWTLMREEIVRQGYAYVGVGAQWVGVASPNPPPLPTFPGSLIVTDPARYGSLAHPGDSFSYDIFSQAAQALRTPEGPDPLGPLKAPERIIAMGESQSASRMVTYINGVHPLTEVYDGFFVHSRFSSSAPLSQSLVAGPGNPATVPATPDIAAPVPARLRELDGLPVFVFQTETDVALAGGTERDDGPWYREWEVTGSAHADAFIVTQGENARELTSFICGPPGATVPINAGPQTWAIRAALRHMDRWVARGIEPPSGDRIERDGSVIRRDAFTGIALGGIRLPDIEVPTLTLSGERGAGGNFFCFLFGKSDPWNGDADPWDGTADDPSGTPEPDLAELYPTHGSYVSQVVQATQQSIRAGYILRDDAADFIKPAVESEIGR
jgi:hypothetical protein